MKGTGYLLEPIVAHTKGWGTVITLQPTTRLRDIKLVRKTWHFAARGPKSEVWTACSTTHDLKKAMGR